LVSVPNVAMSHKNVDMTRIYGLDHCHMFRGRLLGKLQGRQSKLAQIIGTETKIRTNYRDEKQN
jgi:hypothetical protein